MTISIVQKKPRSRWRNLYESAVHAAVNTVGVSENARRAEAQQPEKPCNVCQQEAQRIQAAKRSRAMRKPRRGML